MYRFYFPSNENLHHQNFSRYSSPILSSCYPPLRPVASTCEGASVHYVICAHNPCIEVSSSDVDQWSEWSEWSTCNRECTPAGSSLRKRQCISKTGAECQGESSQSKTCNDVDCPGLWNIRSRVTRREIINRTIINSTSIIAKHT